MKHYPTCTPNYPEKPLAEKPQETIVMSVGGGKRMRICCDCGAHEEIEQQTLHLKEKP